MRRVFALPAALLVLGTALLAHAAPAQDAVAFTAGDAAVIAGPIPEKVTAGSVVVWWQTTRPEKSILTYGTAPDHLPYRVQRPWSTTTHEISLKKLQPATTYYLAIVQPDGSRGPLVQFTTQPRGYARQSSVRIINGPLFEQVTPDSATLAWSSNRPSSFLVRYGTDPQDLKQSVKAPWTPMTHRVVLNSLLPDTRYYFTIEPNPPVEAQQPAQEEQETTQPEPEPQPGAGNGPTQLPEAQDEGTVPLMSPAPPVYIFRTLARGQQALDIGPQH